MRKNIIISLVVSLLVFICGSFTIYKLNINKSVATLNFNNEYKIIAGVIRNIGEGWYLIQDQGHETIGIIGISEDDEKINIKYDKNNKVNALSVTVDETMASEGYRVGCSVGLDNAMIYIYNKENKLVKPRDYKNSKGNIWIEGIFKR